MYDEDIDIYAFDWDIRNEGRAWKTEEIEYKYHTVYPEKIELIQGKLFWVDQERLSMMGLLLENIGVDAVVKFGDIEVWKEAIRRREEKDA